MKKTCFILILGSLLCCKQATEHPKQVSDSFKPPFSKEELYKQLNEISAVSSDKRNDSLEQFFKIWNASISPNTAQFINQNDTYKAIYSLYQTFYRPFDLLTLGQWEWGDKLNSNSNYATIQNKIYYAVLNTDTFNRFYAIGASKDSIVNFRPVLNLDKSKILYLTSEYKKAINDFLGAEATNLGEGNIMNPSMPKGTSAERFAMLRPFIPILHGHNNGWNLETSPTIDVITFNKSFTKAIVRFVVGYQGGEATLVKTNQNWIIEQSKATWIE